MKTKASKKKAKTSRTKSVSMELYDPSKPLKNKRWEVFAQSYISTLSKAAAARAAGATAKSSWQAGYELMRKPEVKARVEHLWQQTYATLVMTREEVLANLTRIAEANMSEYAEWGGGIVELRPSDEVDGMLVKSVSANKHGPRIELHDRKAALDTLARYHGILTQEDAEQVMVLKVRVEREAAGVREAIEEREREKEGQK